MKAFLLKPMVWLCWREWVGTKMKESGAHLNSQYYSFPSSKMYHCCCYKQHYTFWKPTASTPYIKKRLRLHFQLCTFPSEIKIFLISPDVSYAFTTKTAFIKLPVYWFNPPLPRKSMQKRETYWAPASTERVRPWSRSFGDKGPGAQGASTHPQARRRAREGGGLGPGAWGLCVGGVRGTQRALRQGTANIINTILL